METPLRKTGWFPGGGSCTLEAKEKGLDGVLQVDENERLHVLTGAVCNNNCVFCMEEDREGRYVHNSAITATDVKQILESNVGRREVMFTSGEPTLNPNFLRYVSWAKGMGYETIGVITNGRMFSRWKVVEKAVRAGLNHAVVSIHGADEKLHDRLVRTPGAFPETLAGIRNLGRVRRVGLKLHTSTVVNKHNYTALELRRLYDLVAPSVDQMVLNVIQPWGRGESYFERLMPRYSDVAREFSIFVEGVKERPFPFLIDIPYCTTEGLGIPNELRGYTERYVHHDTVEETPLLAHQSTGLADGEIAAKEGLELTLEPDDSFVGSNRDQQDFLTKAKREECRSCRYFQQCDGVWRNYSRRHGWDEFSPVELTSPNIGDAKR